MNSSFSDNEANTATTKWNVSDSFKITKQKLRVPSRDEIRKRQEEVKSPSITSDAKSYLKSRRQKARDERRQNIMGILDDNLDRLETETSSPVKASRKGELHNPAKISRESSSSPGRTSPKGILKKEKSHSRLRALNPFRQKSKTNESNNRDYLKRTKSARRATQRRKEQKEAISNLKQNNKDKNYEMQVILQEVLRKYPKERCKTFADHKEFAFAELAIQSNKNKELHMDAKKFQDLKSMLETHLANTLREDDSVAESTRIDDCEHSRSHPRHQGCDRDRGSPNQKSRVTTDPIGFSDSGRYYQPSQASRTSPRSSPRALSFSSSPDTSPNRKRSVVPSPPPLSTSHRKSSLKDPRRDDVTSSPSPQPKSSQCLQLPTPRTSSMRLGPYIEKDDNTTTTENDDESTLVPVVKLTLVDPNGQVGNYTGTIDVNTGLPHGSGKLEYEDFGTYQGDFIQGKWSGYGRHIKPNGDIYEGNYFENAKHGMGVYRYRDGKRVFEGRYVMGQRVDGKMTYGDGSAYKGQWYDGKRHGRGTYQFKDGSVYKGEFVRDVIHGVGQLCWPDGAKYIGEWNEGHRHGQGKEFTADGKLRYEGKWKESVPIS
ncbi:MORN repeat-containing protein [Nitzschia inconspicua]|uniref:MORN repeat-containing protein n=1 Tax=Nitzschia inconspicua TaxID=303405 RepID=A0A9K3LGF4_9STRA|nr:MORN repeat-containing protein [Nitzschia inconspicua]